MEFSSNRFSSEFEFLSDSINSLCFSLCASSALNDVENTLLCPKEPSAVPVSSLWMTPTGMDIFAGKMEIGVGVEIRLKHRLEIPPGSDINDRLDRIAVP
jgi:hypothetical protein